MASITIRGLDESVKTRLRARAALHGHSMEAEARELLKNGVAAPEISGRELFDSIRAIVAPLGGINLPDALRDKKKWREPPDFGK